MLAVTPASCNFGMAIGIVDCAPPDHGTCICPGYTLVHDDECVPDPVDAGVPDSKIDAGVPDSRVDGGNVDAGGTKDARGDAG